MSLYFRREKERDREITAHYDIGNITGGSCIHDDLMVARIPASSAGSPS